MLANVTCPTCQHRYYLDEGEMLSRQICPKCCSAFFAGKSIADGKAGVSPTLAAAAASAASAQPSYAKTMIGEVAPPIKYNCPRCKAPLEAEGIEGGTKKNCPNCTQRHQVPAAAKSEAVVKAPALDKTMLAGDETAAPPTPPLKYNCPGCKTPLESPADQAGTKRNCPACNQRLQVPAAPSAKPNINKTMLASDESAAPATAAPGAPSANGVRGSVPIAAAAPPANPWALTPKNVAIGIALLLLLVLVVHAVLRGGKVEDPEAVAAAAKAKLDLRRLELEFEQKKLEFDRQEKVAAETRKKAEDEARERRVQEDRIREDNRQTLARIDDDDRRAALKKKQQQDQEKRDAEAREREDKFKQLLEDSQKKLDQTKRDLDAAQQKQQTTQTIIQQPTGYYYPPYHPRYYWPW